jgi:hypothetical protein
MFSCSLLTYRALYELLDAAGTMKLVDNPAIAMIYLKLIVSAVGRSTSGVAGEWIRPDDAFHLLGAP